jgi:hypothetical protein
VKVKGFPLCEAAISSNASGGTALVANSIIRRDAVVVADHFVVTARRGDWRCSTDDLIELSK